MFDIILYILVVYMKTNRVVSNQEIIDALKATGGLVTHASKKINITPKTIYNRMNKYPEVKDAYNDIQEEWIDLAESGVAFHLKNKDPEMIRFFLQTKGKCRGYTKTIEHSFGSPESLQIHLDIKSKKIPEQYKKFSDEENNENIFTDPGAANDSNNKISD